MSDYENKMIHPSSEDSLRKRVRFDSSGKVTILKKDLPNLRKILPTKVEIDMSTKKEKEEKLLTPVLTNAAEEISVPLTAEGINAFQVYAKLLVEWNKVMNLTGIVDDEGIALRHFIDSLTLVPYIEREQIAKDNKKLTLIDVGTGAGFPGIPLKIVKPELKLDLLDSLQKRLNFLNDVCEKLALTDVHCVHSRAEDAGRAKKYREKYDVVTARAVASLPVLCEYCLPFVKTGGVFIAMKGHINEEIENARKAIVTLGGTVERVEKFRLPGTEMDRSVIVIRKLRNTPAQYPRQAGKPEKEPIE